MKFNSDGTCIELTIDEIWGLLVSEYEAHAILRDRVEILEHHHHETSDMSKPRWYVDNPDGIMLEEEK